MGGGRGWRRVGDGRWSSIYKERSLLASGQESLAYDPGVPGQPEALVSAHPYTAETSSWTLWNDLSLSCAPSLPCVETWLKMEAGVGPQCLLLPILGPPNPHFPLILKACKGNQSAP